MAQTEPPKRKTTCNGAGHTFLTVSLEGKDALLVNWLEIAIIKPDGKGRYRNSFVTDLPLNRQTVAEIAACGLSPLEQRERNLQRPQEQRLPPRTQLRPRQGHPGEHAGRPQSVGVCHDNACDLVAGLWQTARHALGARNRPFTHIGPITAYHVFRSWHTLMRTIITGVPPPATA